MSNLRLMKIAILFFVILTFALGCNFEIGNSQIDKYQPTPEFQAKIYNEVDSINSSVELQAYLRQIYALDQKYRAEENDVLDKFGHDSKEYKQIWEKINQTDAENLVRVEYIFKKFGYPKRSEVGEIAASAPWFVVHHVSGDNAVREKHFKIIYRAYVDGNISGGQMDFYLGRMYRIKFGTYFNMPSQFKEHEKIDTLIQILELKKK